ncbi:hypothetical protein GCM10011390_42010 [Aureimonas endophytica]|uniref:Uncharacterized protein n=1 Tax=Aureimonas endophytica TaxID=2027858 RepID=A0A916ZZ11_9HYPH|nr:hypothetical protein [Aureimonas endophytica]GGE18428.1 hypothetical protein GCM10011390_42010 [Aureimonas endophytica]
MLLTFSRHPKCRAILWLIAYGSGTASRLFMAAMLLLIVANGSAHRVSLETQELGSMAPRGCASCVSLASREAGK